MADIVKLTQEAEQGYGCAVKAVLESASFNDLFICGTHKCMVDLR
jgi:hypothetical protein